MSEYQNIPQVSMRYGGTAEQQSTAKTNGSGNITIIEDGTDDYTELENKPQINSVEVIGNKNGNDLLLVNQSDIMSEAEIDAIIYGGLGNG